MQRQDRRGLRACPESQGVTCLKSPCPGESDRGVCRHLDRLHAWRDVPRDDQGDRIWAGDSTFHVTTEPSRDRIRVGLLCPCLGLGGAEVWQLALARAVDHDAIVWQGAAVIDGPTSCDPWMESELGSLMPVGFGLNAARRLAASCDIVISWAVTDIPSLLAGLEQPPLVVIACHFPAESPWGEGTGALLEGVSLFVAVSELAVESTPTSIRDRIEVIWNAVEPQRMEIQRPRSSIRASWGVPDEALVAGYLGRLSPEKDPDAMIRLATQLPEPWHVVIVGEGRERNALEQRVEDQQLGRTHVVGGSALPGDVLRAFDTLVVPSRYESFGLTIAEGLWAEIPVVATRSGIARLVPGLVREIEVNASAQDLAAAVLADRDDPSGTLSRVKLAHLFAKSRLGVERFGREWTELLLRIHGRRRGGEPCLSAVQAA